MHVHLLSLPDINECGNETLNDCHPNALCNNTIGSYTCTCKDGYSGDGKNSCEGIILNKTTFIVIVNHINLSWSCPTHQVLHINIIVFDPI